MLYKDEMVNTNKVDRFCLVGSYCTLGSVFLAILSACKAQGQIVLSTYCLAKTKKQKNTRADDVLNFNFDFGFPQS